MYKSRPIFYSALMLTGVNLLLRFVGTSFQVYISNRIGASGVGLLQLIMSVGNLTVIAGMGGIRTATMYLAAEELGKKHRENTVWVLSECMLYSIVCSGAVAAALYVLSPQIAIHWIGDIRTVYGLRLYSAFLPVTCLCGVMTGFFTAENKIGTLAAVEISEQFVSMGVTILLLSCWAGENAVQACQSVIMGSCAGSCLTLICLSILRLRDRQTPGRPVVLRQRLFSAAIPLAVSDIAKAGINTAENLMVPKRLQLHSETGTPLAAFGLVTGMVFPVIMFPACILFGLAELLIPELARCMASGSRTRIRYLVRRSLKASMVYGLAAGGIVFLLAHQLCMALFRNAQAVDSLRTYSLLIPMLYCDAITDAMTKGLGQQKICVRYNIITSAMDVVLLFLLLPRYGMRGYFISFALTHFINFALSLNRLLKITDLHIPFYVPALGFSSGCIAVAICGTVTAVIPKVICYLSVLVSVMYLFRILSREDFLWVRNLVVSDRGQLHM